MRLWTFLLLLILVAVAVNCGRSSETNKLRQKQEKELPPLADGDPKELDDQEESKASVKKSTKKDKAPPPDSNEVNEEDFKMAPIMQDEVREDILQRLQQITEHVKEAGLPVEDSEDDHSKGKKGGYDVCGKDMACTCEGTELICDKESYEDGPFDSVNVYPVYEGTIKTASFKDNAISKLVRKSILPHCATGIEQLILSKNHISKLTEDSLFQGFSSLKKLYLDDNRIDNITQSALKYLPKLHQLYLNDNKITKLESGVFFELKDLKKLVLDGNKLELSMGLFQGLGNLEELSLDNCNITELNSDVFNNLHSLKKLSLRNNPIVEIPKAINSLRALEWLDISGTNIPEFHAKELNDDIFLKSLRMEEMPYLYTIQECAFCGLERLTELLMKNNTKLSSIHLNAFGLGTGDKNAVKSLKHLNLENCNLTNFPEGMINWEHLEEFIIGGNPIDCSCDTTYMMSDGFYDNFIKTESVATCATPAIVKGKPLPSVDPNLICDDYKGPEQFRRSAGKGIVFFGLLLILCIASIGLFHMYSTGRLAVIWNNVRNKPNQFPTMSYANLNSNVEDNRALEADFQPRPEEV